MTSFDFAQIIVIKCLGSNFNDQFVSYIMHLSNGLSLLSCQNEDSKQDKCSMLQNKGSICNTKIYFLTVVRRSYHPK